MTNPNDAQRALHLARQIAVRHKDDEGLDGLQSREAILLIDELAPHIRAMPDDQP